MARVTNEELTAFSGAYEALIADSPDGTQYLDGTKLIQLVRQCPAAARRYVEIDMLAGVASPRLLRNALFIASAIAAEGDHGPLQAVRDRIRDLEAEDEIGAFNVLPDTTVPAGLSTPRAKAIEWWAARPSQDGALCDGCARPLPRGEGYIVDLGSRWIGPTEVKLGEGIICEVCYLRRR